MPVSFVAPEEGGNMIFFNCSKYVAPGFQNSIMEQPHWLWTEERTMKDQEATE